MQKQVTLTLPNWIDKFLTQNMSKFQTLQQKMKFVLALCRENIIQGTGGPFSAAIFNTATNQLVSCGVNRVMPENSSCAHAEMMAIMLGQKTLGSYDFSAVGKFLLVTSGKMCVMCMGGVIWSGLTEVATSALPSDVQQITGFDEGPTPKEYNFQLNKRGINVIDGVLRQQGRQVLKLYVQRGGFVYNSNANKLAQK